MRPFLPVFTFVIVSFLLLAAWIDYSSPEPALCPLLYYARLVAWIFALSVSSVAFLRPLMRGRLRRIGATLFAALAIMIFYPCDGFLTAHAEEHVIRYKMAHRDPSDDMGASYLYGSISPGMGGSSGGVADAIRSTQRGFSNGLFGALMWLPLVGFVARCVYPRTASPSEVRNA